MLNKNKRPKPDAEFLETPAGIFTTSGNWFRTRRDLLEAYVPGLFDVHPLEKIIKNAEIWIRSTDMLGILISMIMLLIFPLGSAIGLAIGAGLIWHIVKPGFVSLPATGLLKMIDYEIVILVIALIPLSWFGMEAMYGHLISGLLLFMAFKFGLIRKIGELLYGKIKSGAPAQNDRILNMLIIRHAMSAGIEIPEIARMEKEIMVAVQKTSQQHKRMRKK